MTGNQDLPEESDTMDGPVVPVWSLLYFLAEESDGALVEIEPGIFYVTKDLPAPRRPKD